MIKNKNEYIFYCTFINYFLLSIIFLYTRPITYKLKLMFYVLKLKHLLKCFIKIKINFLKIKTFISVILIYLSNIPANKPHLVRIGLLNYQFHNRLLSRGNVLNGRIVEHVNFIHRVQYDDLHLTSGTR